MPLPVAMPMQLKESLPTEEITAVLAENLGTLRQLLGAHDTAQYPARLVPQRRIPRSCFLVGAITEERAVHLARGKLVRIDRAAGLLASDCGVFFPPPGDVRLRETLKRKEIHALLALDLRSPPINLRAHDRAVGFLQYLDGNVLASYHLQESIHVDLLLSHQRYVVLVLRISVDRNLDAPRHSMVNGSVRAQQKGQAFNDFGCRWRQLLVATVHHLVE
mmetsp:Transcript_78648/g.218372  ORF Transcript_78648/g.218372 Transcript_78648/m.218372 type:complete len:219 (-) Transcript_78648:1292-1948(-)